MDHPKKYPKKKINRNDKKDLTYHLNRPTARVDENSNVYFCKIMRCQVCTRNGRIKERKARRKPVRQRPPPMERRREGERERKAMLSTSTRC